MLVTQRRAARDALAPAAVPRGDGTGPQRLAGAGHARRSGDEGLGPEPLRRQLGEQPADAGAVVMGILVAGVVDPAPFQDAQVMP